MRTIKGQENNIGVRKEMFVCACIIYLVVSLWRYNRYLIDEVDYLGIGTVGLLGCLPRLSSWLGSQMHRWHQQGLPHLWEGCQRKRKGYSCWSWLPQILRFRWARLLALHLLGCWSSTLENRWLLISLTIYPIFISKLKMQSIYITKTCTELQPVEIKKWTTKSIIF